MDVPLVLCFYCGVHWPESHIGRVTAYSSKYVGVQRVSACYECLDEAKLLADAPEQRDRRIAKRDRLLAKIRKQQRPQPAEVEWAPDVQPPR